MIYNVRAVNTSIFFKDTSNTSIQFVFKVSGRFALLKSGRPLKETEVLDNDDIAGG
jgi:hypothetical protein